MKSFKRIISVLLAVIVFVTSLAYCISPVYAEESAYQYEAQAKTLNELGLFKGTSVTTFQPDLGAKLDRQQGIAMILRLLGKIDAAEAMTQEQIDAALKNYADTANIEPSLKKSIAYAILNGLVKGDGSSIMPKDPMSGKDFATILLRNLGYKDTEFTYEKACSELAKKNVITEGEAANFNDKDLIRDDLVGMSFGALKAVAKDGKTVMDKIIETKPELAEKAEKAGVYKRIFAPTPTPTSFPVIIPSTGGNPGSNNSDDSTPPSAPLSFTASVVGASKIQLTFNRAIDVTKAVIKVKTNDIDVAITKTSSSEDKKSVTLETYKKIAQGKYDIIVNGLGNSLTYSFNTENEKVTKLRFLGNKAFLNPSNSSEITAYYRVYNQYNEDVSSATYKNINFVAGKGNITVIDCNTIKISTNSYSEFLEKEKIAMSALYIDFNSDCTVFNSKVYNVGVKVPTDTNPLTDVTPFRVDFTEARAIPNIVKDPTGKSILCNLKVYDLYYDEITKECKNNTDIVIKSDKGTASPLDENGNFTLTSDTLFNIGEVVSVSVYNIAKGTSASTVYTIRKGIDIYEIESKGIYNKDNLKISVDNFNNNKFYLLFDVKNEYGQTVTDYTYINDRIFVGNSNYYMIDVSNPITTIGINGKTQLALPLLSSTYTTVPQEGVVNIFIISKESGKGASARVAIYNGPTIEKFDMQLPYEVSSGAETIISFAAFDQDGNAIKDISLLSKINFFIVTDGNAKMFFRENETTGKTELILDLKNTTYKGVAAIMVDMKFFTQQLYKITIK